MIKKIHEMNLQNEFVVKIKYSPSQITIEDLKVMYKCCRRKKIHCAKSFTKLSSSIDDGQENAIISAIKNNDTINNNICLNWFKYPKNKTNLAIIIEQTSQMIKRGEIDSAITQTSILNKDFDNNANILNKTNLDVHRIGRFTRNVATNNFLEYMRDWKWRSKSFT